MSGRHRSSTLLMPLLVVAALAAVAATWTWSRAGDPALYPATDAGVTVHILDNGFHTDLAVPRAALLAQPGPLADAVATLPPGDWILIGWGDAKFYVEQTPIQQRLPDGLRAFFRPGNASVVMLDPAQRDPALLFAEDGRASLMLSRAGFAAMARRIENSLALTDRRAVVVTARPGDDARFFASHEHFWIGYLCNNWTARVLNAAGLPIRPMRAVTSGEVMNTVTRNMGPTIVKLDTAARRD
ncbi:MAG: DUF2459 domain-containing protein [Phenylobacterium sp.]|nr:DUF2459 domain-containing protein [Phenylobacterium sp.]